MTITGSGNAVYCSARATTGYATGKYYFEVYKTGDSFMISGVSTISQSLNCSASIYCGSSAVGWGQGGLGYRYHSGPDGSYGSTSQTDGFTFMCAFDASNGNIWVGQNGTWNGDPAAGTGAMYTNLSGTVYATISVYSTATATLRTTEADCTYSAPTGFDYYQMPAYTLSGTLKEKEGDASGAAYQYLLLDATNHSVYAHGTAAADGTYSETVANGTDEYCGVIIDNIGGATYDGNFGIDTTDVNGDWSITDAGWTEGDTVWAFFVDPDKTYKTIAAEFTANASNTISGTHQENGSAASGILVYAAGFGVSSGTYNPKPIFDFAVGGTP